MTEKPKQAAGQPEAPKTYEFLNEFEKRNSLIEALRFALAKSCDCEACKKLKVFADVLEEDRKKGGDLKLTP